MTWHFLFQSGWSGKCSPCFFGSLKTLCYGMRLSVSFWLDANHTGRVDCRALKPLNVFSNIVGSEEDLVAAEWSTGCREDPLLSAESQLGGYTWLKCPFMALNGFLKQEMTSGHLSGSLQEPCHSRVEEVSLEKKPLTQGPRHPRPRPLLYTKIADWMKMLFHLWCTDESLITK